MRVRFVFITVGFLSLILSLAAQTSINSSASAHVPPLIQFSNVATDEGGNTLSGVVNITFSLYSTQQGGEPLWTETQNNVQLDPSGHYSVMLGVTKATGVPTALFISGEARWLGVKIEQQSEQPRVLLLSVPYALKAGDAETLGGKPASAYALAGAPVALATGPTESSTVTGSAPAEGSASEVQPMTTNCSSITSDGAAVVNALAKFTSPCNVGGSAISENGGRVGIGGAGVSGAKLALSDTQTNFGLKWLQHSVFDTAATTNGTNYALGLDADASNMTIAAGVTDKGYRLGVFGRGFADTAGFAGTLAQQFGVNGSAGILAGKSGAKVESAYGGYYQIYNNVPGTTITNAYGVYIANSQTSGTITNRYDLYASSANAKNYFAGTLEVNGTTKFDSPVSFAGGQTFPGIGTITGVTAGTDLTGGGTKGSVTLNLDTTRVPQLSTANTFTGTQTVNGTLSATAVTANSYNIGSNPFSFGSYFNQDVFLGFAGNPTRQTQSYYNTAIGVSALSLNTTGGANTAVGASALESNTSGGSNTAVGFSALISNTTGVYNTAEGLYTLDLDTNGSHNTAVGNEALWGNTTGSYNTAIGENAYHGSCAGNYNTALGVNTLYETCSGSYNTAIGENAVFRSDGGNYNTGVGVNALNAFFGGNGNSSLGEDAGGRSVK